MARGLNKVHLIGNLGRDPEVRNYEDNRIKVSFSLATGKAYRTSEGELRTRAEWHNIILWTPLAEVAEKYLSKGKQVYIEGEVTTRSYEDKQGHTKYITEIIGKEILLLSNLPDTSIVNKDERLKNVTNNPAFTPEPPSTSKDKEDELPF